MTFYQGTIITRKLEIHLLGPPRIAWRGESFPLARRQARALLYYLVNARAPVSRARLLYLFWPDEPDVKARRNLTRLVSYLRQELPQPEMLKITRESLQVNPAGVWVDVERFSNLCADADTCESAVPLYHGTFLTGFSLANSPEFDFWLTEEQGRYEALYLQTLADLVRVHRMQCNYEVALQFAQQYLAVDELAEEIHRSLISLYGAIGDRASAQRQYEKCVTILERELGVAPLPETRTAFEAAFREPVDELITEPPTAIVKPVWSTLSTLDLPLTGREESWKKLADAFQRLHTGGVISITGEPGIGKSRLLQEFATSQPDCLVLTGNSHETTQELPYQPLTQAMRLALEQAPLWTDIQPIWLAEATRILPDLKAHFPHLSEPVEVEPKQAQARVFEALSQIFLGMAAKRPLLLCLDDLHWADEATLGWLNYLSSRLAESHLCLLITYRSQEAEPLSGLRETLRRAGLRASVTLTGLSSAAIERLLLQLPEPIPDPHLLAARLRQATAGNPFFTLETIRSLWESSQLTSSPAKLPLPDTVQETIRDRLARLEAIGQQVLDAAAVLSPDLNFEILEPTAGRSEAEMLDGVDRLLEHQILLEDPTGLRFQHDLFRAVVYEDLNQWRRRSLHRRAAAALIEFHRRDPETAAMQVANHYEKAGEIEAAVEWYMQAADVAQKQYANDETIGSLERAIALSVKLPGNPDRTTWLYESLGDSLVIAGRMQSADAAYKSAVSHCPEDDRLRLAALHQKQAHIYPPQGRMEESDAIYRKALEALGPEPGDLPAVNWWRAWLDVQLSRYEVFYYQARLPEMEKLAAEIEPILEQYGSTKHRLNYNSIRTMLVLRQKRYNLCPEDLEFIERAAEDGPAEGDEMKRAYFDFGVSFGQLWAGQREQAGKHLRQLLAKAEALAYLPLQDQCLAYLTIASRLAGEEAQARFYQARSAEVAHQVGAPYYVGVAAANQAWLNYLDEEWDLAITNAQKALECWQGFAYPFQWLALWPLLAIAVTRKDLAAAIASAEAMLDPNQQQLPDDITETLEWAVQAWKAEKPGETQRALEQALTLANDCNYL